MQYSDEVMDHFTNPRNVGSLDERAVDVGTGTFGSPSCGDVLKLQIRVDSQGVIVEAKFKTFGCGSAVASSSLLTEKIIGKTLAQAKELSNTEIARELQLPPIKVHCSVMAEEALKSAIADYQAKNG